jgi:hypothetical protein
LNASSLRCFKGPRGERCSPARRRSRRQWYARNAEPQRKKALAYYYANRETILARKRSKGWAARRRARLNWRRLTEQEWIDAKRYYQVANRTEPFTFWELALHFKVSPRAIQARSSRDGGWSLRATTDRKLPASKRAGRAR